MNIWATQYISTQQITVKAMIGILIIHNAQRTMKYQQLILNKKNKRAFMLKGQWRQIPRSEKNQQMETIKVESEKGQGKRGSGNSPAWIFRCQTDDGKTRPFSSSEIDFSIFSSLKIMGKFDGVILSISSVLGQFFFSFSAVHKY